MLEISSKDEIFCNYCKSDDIELRGQIGSIILFICCNCHETGVCFEKNGW